MALTAKQEAFAQAIASGKTQADAYRSSYNAGKMSDAVIWVKASELASDGNVAVRIAALKAELAERQLWTREDSAKTLIEIATGDDKASDRISAVKELNSMHGFNEPTKIEHKGGVWLWGANG